MYTKTRKTVMAALMAALICVATFVIKIPTPLHGYMNLGDPLVLFAAALLSPGYAAVAAGLGSALADVLSGYIIYAPATFVIKALMALIFSLFVRAFARCSVRLPLRIIGAVISELFMVLGYFLFEGFIYGFGAALINAPANGIQAAAGALLGVILIQLSGRAPFARNK